MWHLLLEIWIWLFLAALLGLGIGWILWGRNFLTEEERVRLRLQQSRRETVRINPGKYLINPRFYRERNREDLKKKKKEGTILAQDL